MRLAVLASAALLLTGPAAADNDKPVHLCAAAAQEEAARLLRYNYEDDHNLLALEPGPPKAGDDPERMTWSIGDQVKLLEPVPTLTGAGKFDVLEIYGQVGTESYRMHFLYAQFPDTCLLMGQEIVQDSNPY